MMVGTPDPEIHIWRDISFEQSVHTDQLITSALLFSSFFLELIPVLQQVLV